MIISLVVGILMIVAGCFMFTTPIANILTISWILSLVILVNGVGDIIQFFMDKEKRSIWNLMAGVLSTLVGVWIFFGQGTIIDMAAILPFMFGFWLMSMGCVRIGLSSQIKERGLEGSGGVMAFGVFNLIYGFIVMFHPLLGFISLSYLLSFIFIFQGVSLIGTYSFMKKQKKL